MERVRPIFDVNKAKFDLNNLQLEPLGEDGRLSDEAILKGFKIRWFEDSEYNPFENIQNPKPTAMLCLGRVIIEYVVEGDGGYREICTLSNRHNQYNQEALLHNYMIDLMKTRTQFPPENLPEYKLLAYFRKTVYGNGDVYIGEVSRGKPDGEGAYYFEDRDYFYIGGFSKNLKQGKGHLKQDDLEYEGEFFENKFHGKGKLMTKDYDYEGKFKNGLFNGLGELRNKFDDDKNQEGVEGSAELRLVRSYKGEFLEGKYHGKGILHYKDGTHYEGEFDNSVQTGQGKMTFRSGRTFEGEFRNAEIVKGVHKAPLELEIEDYVLELGKKAGMADQGVLDAAKKALQENARNAGLEFGVHYEGSFYESKPHGFGKLKNFFGAEYEGYFEHGVKKGFGTELLTGGDVYSGNFEDGHPGGVGKLFEKNGNQFIGTFRRVEGNLECDGMMTSGKDGSELRGLFRNGELVEEYFDDEDGDEGGSGGEKGNSGGLNGQNDGNLKFSSSCTVIDYQRMIVNNYGLYGLRPLQLDLDLWAGFRARDLFNPRMQFTTSSLIPSSRVFKSLRRFLR